MKFFFRRFAALFLTLLMVSFLTFIGFQVIPGDSAASKLGMDATEEQVNALREAMGLNKSIPARFTSFLAGVVQGDFGTSLQYEVPVKDLVKDRLPVTLWLAVLSIAMLVLVSIPLGILCAKKENGIFDRIITFLSHLCMAIPPFFLGILITMLFGIVLQVFVPGRYQSPQEGFFGFLKYLIFPAAAVAIPKIAMTVKFLRSSILGELKTDYVKTAKSKGNSDGQVLVHHVLKNALMPVITFLGMIIADAFAGSIVIEQVFNLPGMGRLLVVAIANRDYPVVQCVVLYIAAVVILVNFIVDLLYHKIDPRVRLS